MGAVRSFMDNHFLHFNSGTAVRAARAWEAHLTDGGEMMVAMAGAMSTARIGRILARVIREGKVHAITCTGANLEEDVFALLAYESYERIPRWRDLSAEEEVALLDRGMNRVTDVCIPETVMRHLEDRLLVEWRKACDAGISKRPAEFMFDVLRQPDLEQHFQLPREESWVLAAMEMGVPIWTPGWEDSTTGNMLTAFVWQGKLPHHRCVVTGTEQLASLMRWYVDHQGVDRGRPAPGFFQIGGGIAGDFPICAVPCLMQDLEQDVPLWGYFCQISDAVTSYGGYSGAPPNEKITWGKLGIDTPRFMVQSDATIVAPLMFAYLLGD